MVVIELEVLIGDVDEVNLANWVLLRTKSSVQQTQNPRVSNGITRVMPALIDVTPKQPAYDVMMRETRF